MKKNLIIPILVLSILGCAQTSTKRGVYYRESKAYRFVEEGWNTLSRGKYAQAHQAADDCLYRYSKEAEALNVRCDVDTPENFRGCELLNDVSQCLFIKAKAYSATKEYGEVMRVCSKLNADYYNSYIVDPRGYPWRPSEACKELIGNK